VVKKADKSRFTVIMNKEDNIAEVKRQLNNPQYYTKLNHDPSSSIHSNILKYIDELSKVNRNILHEFDIFR
jgi:hypothetical protein